MSPIRLIALLSIAVIATLNPAPAPAAAASEPPRAVTTAESAPTSKMDVLQSNSLPSAFPPLTPYVVLYNVSNGRCADIPNFGKGTVGMPVSQYYCRPGDYDNQQVRIVRVGQYDRFLIQVKANGTGSGALCYDLPNYGSVPKGTAVSLYHCRPYNDNQLFYLRQVGGAFQIVHNSTNMCLDVAGLKSSSPGARLLLWTCNTAGDDHLWWLRNPATTPVQQIPPPARPHACGTHIHKGTSWPSFSETFYWGNCTDHSQKVRVTHPFTKGTDVCVPALTDEYLHTNRGTWNDAMTGVKFISEHC